MKLRHLIQQMPGRVQIQVLEHKILRIAGRLLSMEMKVELSICFTALQIIQDVWLS